MLSGIVMIILLAFLIIWKADILGVSESRLEQDARERQKIKSSWEVVQAVNENIGAMLFYDEQRVEAAYSVYLSRGGISYGYFFSQGGLDENMVDGVKGIVFEDRGIVLLSLNQDKVSKVVVDDGTGEKVIPVDSGKPFAMLLPVGCEEITMYDIKDNIVKLYETED